MIKVMLDLRSISLGVKVI